MLRDAPVCVCVPTGAGQVPAGVFGVFPVPDGSAHGADQRHDQQDAKQDQDLHIGHPLHVGALQRRLGGVLGGRSMKRQRVETYRPRKQEDTLFLGRVLNFTCISLESWPVYTTIPTTHWVFLSWAPRNNTWSGPKGAGLKTTRYNRQR